MDILAYILAKKYTDKIAETFAGGLKYQGSVADVSKLPAASSSNKGHMYTTLNDGHEHVSDGKQWVDLGADLNNKADKAELTAETNDRISADDILVTNLNQEISARTSADATLQTNIDAKQAKLTAGANITIDANNVISASTAQAPEYIELSFYDDLDTGTLTDAQAATLAASELNYIWLNGMHRLDFRYEDKNNNKATYSAVDTSSDGNKTHSVEINLTTKAFTVYHRTLQEYISDLATIRSGAALGATAIQQHQDISGKADKSYVDAQDATKINLLGNVDDPSDPGYGFAYHIPYDATFTANENDITIGLKTITFDNNKTKMVFNKQLPAATESNIGLMTASQVTDLKSKQNKLTSENAGDSIAITEPSSSSHNLPKAYQEVEYIEKQYADCADNSLIINLGLDGGLTQYGVDLKFTAGPSVNKNYFILSNANQWDFAGIQVSTNDSNKLIFNYGKSYHTFDPKDIGTANTDITFSNKNGVLTVNGANRGSFNTSTAVKMTGPLTLWGTLSGTNICNGYGKCYYLKIYSDIACTTLVRDLIPCYRKSDNRVGLYDLVNNIFYTNTGANVFTTGEKVITETLISVSAQSVDLTGESGTLTEAQVSLLANSTLSFVTLGGKKYTFSSAVAGRSGIILIYSCSVDGVDESVEITGTAWVHRKTELQPKLVSGTNIRTINNTSLLGEGNVSIKTYQPFPDDFITDSSLEVFISSIRNSSGRGTGMAYLGAIYGTVCPWGYGNAECKVEYMTDNIALVTVSSANVSPYFWIMNTFSGNWLSFSTLPDLPSDASSKTYTLKAVNGVLTWVE